MPYYSQSEIAKALETYHDLRSVSRTIKKIGYPTRAHLYTWIHEEGQNKTRKTNEAFISVAFPETEYQRCLVHQIRNTLKYVANKDRKQFAADLKGIYNAATEVHGAEIRDSVAEKWSAKYPKQ